MLASLCVGVCVYLVIVATSFLVCPFCEGSRGLCGRLIIYMVTDWFSCNYIWQARANTRADTLSGVSWAAALGVTHIPCCMLVVYVWIIDQIAPKTNILYNRLINHC